MWFSSCIAILIFPKAMLGLMYLSPFSAPVDALRVLGSQSVERSILKQQTLYDHLAHLSPLFDRCDDSVAKKD